MEITNLTTGIKNYEFIVASLPEYYRTELQNLREHYSLEKIGKHLLTRDRTYFERVAKHEEKTRRVLLALEDANLEGVLESSICKEGRFQIANILWVLARKKGKGVGTLLIRHYLNEVKESCNIVALSVSKTNSNAARLYERLEFKYTCNRPDDPTMKVYTFNLSSQKEKIDKG